MKLSVKYSSRLFLVGGALNRDLQSFANHLPVFTLCYFCIISEKLPCHFYSKALFYLVGAGAALDRLNYIYLGIFSNDASNQIKDEGTARTREEKCKRVWLQSPSFCN